MCTIISSFESMEAIEVKKAMQAYLFEKIKTGRYRKCLCDACNVRKIPMLIRSDVDFSLLSGQNEPGVSKQMDQVD